MATAVLQPSDVGDVGLEGPEEVEHVEQERVLGASTADQVLERWHGFMAETSKLLKSLEPPAWRYRLPLSRLTVTTPTTSQVDWSNQLGLSFSPTGRVVYSLSASVEQARSCLAQAPQIYDALGVFGEALGPEMPEEDSLQTPSSLLIELAELIPTLSKARQLLRRADAVAGNILMQLAKTQAMPIPGLAKQPLRLVLDVLGELLSISVKCDGLVLENSRLRRAYTSFKWIVEKASTSNAGSGGQLPELGENGTALLRELQEATPLLRGDAFQGCLANVSASLASLKNELGTAGISAFREHLITYFRGRMEESEIRGQVAISQLWLPGESLLCWICCFVCSVRSFGRGREEAKLMQELWKMHKKAPVVVLFGRVVWCIGDFFKSYLPEVIADAKLSRDLDELRQLRLSQAKQLDEKGFAQEICGYQKRAAAWIASLPKQKLEGVAVSDALASAYSVIFEGLTLALRIRMSLEEYLVLHVREGVAVPRSSLSAVALGFQLLKIIEAAPTLRLQELGDFLQRHSALRLQKELQEVRSKLKRGASEAPGEALRLCACALQRILKSSKEMDCYFDVGGIALALCCSGRSEPANSGVLGRWRELQIICHWQDQLSRLCDTTWCYWLRDLLPTLLSDMQRVQSLPPLFSAFAQPLQRLPMGRARQEFLKELRLALEDGIIQPICAKLEEDLRLLVHATMQGTRQALPLSPPEDALAFLRLRPLRLTESDVVDIKDQVELRLSRHFYDLAALAPQDAEAYVRMREQASHRYGLNLVDGGLPAGSLAQGLDVIDVMRNVHLLATQYCYSLHQQFFTQAAHGDAKIRTITVEHLTASIRVHGYGVINTAVNYSVGFLKKKLEVVAEFLADESVKSRLLAEQQWMEGRPAYTWARAVETARFVRRLGAGRDGVTFLDKLRQVLTQIGNSLGYVRMVRTAGMRSMADGLEYLEGTPWLGAAEAAEDLVQAAEAGGSTASVQAARLAELGARSVRRCFEASTDHLNLLADVFVKALSRTNVGVGSAHSTQLFHLLLPSLCCAFLDSLLLGRDCLAKRAVANTGVKGDAVLQDDGFAVGVAFVLRVFGLNRDFQSLHWFQTEINDIDMTTGQARAAAGLPFFTDSNQSKTEADRRGKLLAELAQLAASLEAAGALFGSTARVPVQPVPAEPMSSEAEAQEHQEPQEE